MKSISRAGESERVCGKVCQEGTLGSIFPQYLADVLYLVGGAVSHGPSFIKLCNRQSLIRPPLNSFMLRDPPKCAASSKQGFLETGLRAWTGMVSL